MTFPQINLKELYLKVNKLGVGKKLWGDSWSKLIKGVYHTVWCHTQQEKIGERRGKEGRSWLWCLSSQETVTHAEDLLSAKRLDICLPVGSSEWVPLFHLLACTAFTFPIKLSLSLFMSLLVFLLFSPHPIGEESDQEVGWVFGCWPSSTHHRDINQIFFSFWTYSLV